MALPTASDNPFPSLLLVEGAAPAAPAAGERRLYADANHVLRWKDSASLDSPLAAVNKWGATVAPAITDDSGDGYAVGSRWIDTTADKEYVCLDSTVGAAVWTETTGAGGSGIPQGGPLTADLDADGFSITDLVDPTNPQDVATKAYADSVGGAALLYDYEVTGSDKASIDTNVDDGGNGAALLPGSYKMLEVFFLHRTDDAGASANPDIIFNNDTGANYYRQAIKGVNATASAAFAGAGNSLIWDGHGSGGSAAFASVMQLVIPVYAGTTFNKAGMLTVATPDGTSTNNVVEEWAVAWGNTAALTRLKVRGNFSAGTTKFKVGSRLLIFAR